MSHLDIPTAKVYARPMSTPTDPDPRMAELRPTDEEIAGWEQQRLLEEASDPANERPEEYWLDTDWLHGDADR